MHRHAFVAFVAFVIVCASSQVAIAAAYDHFSTAMAAQDRGDTDLAISEFTAAINAGDLNAGLLPTAYLERGIAYGKKSDCAHAAADAASALQLKPNYREALNLQAGANGCAGKYDLAISQYHAIAAAWPSEGAFVEEAIAYWKSGNYAGAEQPLTQALALAPNSAYDALWLAMMHARAADAPPAMPADVDEDTWPGPVQLLYAGKSSPDAVMTAAARGDADAVVGQTCQANFYVAEWWLAQKQPANAWPLLAAANAKCPKRFPEYRFAAFELTHPRGAAP